MAAWVLERMRDFAERNAIVWNGATVTYGELSALCDGWEARLDDAGVESGRVVAVVGDFSPDSCAAFLALTRRGGIIVPLMPGTYAKNPEFLEIAEVEFIVDCSDEPSITRRDCTVENELIRSLVKAGAPGLVLFSSGSTGVSKAALHALTPLLEKFRTRRPALRTLTFLLLDHIGGINTFFHVISNGGLVVATSDRTPRGVCQAIQDMRVELLPVSPTFLNLCLLSGEFRRFDLSSLKKITYGTEPMPQSTLDRLHEEFPEVTLQQTYGLSELGIMRTKSRDDGSLWLRVGGEGYETQIRDNMLWIHAKSAMLGYLNAPSPFDDDGWFNTHDLVEQDGEYIHILGRDTEIINVGGEKVYPVEVESRLLKLDNISDAIVYAEHNALSGNMVVACVNLSEPEGVQQLKKRIRLSLKGELEPYKIPQKVVIAEDEQFNERFKRIRLDHGAEGRG